MRSTAGQIAEFAEGRIWKDICDELDIWLRQIRDELENNSLAFSHRTLDQLGGCAKALRNVKDIPIVLVGLAEDENYEREFLKDIRDIEGGRNE